MDWPSQLSWHASVKLNGFCVITKNKVSNLRNDRFYSFSALDSDATAIAQTNQWTEILTNLKMCMMNPNQVFTVEESTNATKDAECTSLPTFCV